MVLHDDLAVVVVQEFRDGGVCKGGDEGAQRLEGRHPYPPGNNKMNIRCLFQCEIRTLGCTKASESLGWSVIIKREAKRFDSVIFTSC